VNASTLTALLSLVTTANVTVIDNGAGLTVYVTAETKDAVVEASPIVGKALENFGMSGRFARSSGRTIWRTVIGAGYGDCKGYLGDYRCGFEVRAFGA